MPLFGEFGADAAILPILPPSHRSVTVAAICAEATQSNKIAAEIAIQNIQVLTEEDRDQLFRLHPVSPIITKALVEKAGHLNDDQRCQLASFSALGRHDHDYHAALSWGETLHLLPEPFQKEVFEAIEKATRTPGAPTYLEKFAENFGKYSAASQERLLKITLKLDASQRYGLLRRFLANDKDIKDEFVRDLATLNIINFDDTNNDHRTLLERCLARDLLRQQPEFKYASRLQNVIASETSHTIGYALFCDNPNEKVEELLNDALDDNLGFRCLAKRFHEFSEDHRREIIKFATEHCPREALELFTVVSHPERRALIPDETGADFADALQHGINNFSVVAIAERLDVLRKGKTFHGEDIDRIVSDLAKRIVKSSDQGAHLVTRLASVTALIVRDKLTEALNLPFEARQKLSSRVRERDQLSR